MLKGMPKVMSPDLMYTLLRMGHGDEIVIADGNFPSESSCTNVIRADGLGGAEILSAVMKFFPLDTYDESVILMSPVEGDRAKFPDGKPPIWKVYEDIITKEEGPTKMIPIDRFKFYARAKKAFAIVATGESAIYANIILKKGVIAPPQ